MVTALGTSALDRSAHRHLSDPGPLLLRAPCLTRMSALAVDAR